MSGKLAGLIGVHDDTEIVPALLMQERQQRERRVAGLLVIFLPAVREIENGVLHPCHTQQVGRVLPDRPCSAPSSGRSVAGSACERARRDRAAQISATRAYVFSRPLWQAEEPIRAAQTGRRIGCGPAR